MAEVEMGKVALAQRTEETAKSGRKKIEPAGLDGGVLEPVDALWTVLRGIDGGVGVKVMKFKQDFLGATFFGEPVTN